MPIVYLVPSRLSSVSERLGRGAERQGAQARIEAPSWYAFTRASRVTRYRTMERTQIFAAAMIGTRSYHRAALQRLPVSAKTYIPEYHVRGLE